MIHIPYLGCNNGFTQRRFYSSLSRLQGNSWDDFLPRLTEYIPPNGAFVIRIVQEDGSGVLVSVPSYSQFGALSYSMDADAEASFLDDGDARIQYLSPAEAPDYNGLVLRGRWRRVWGMEARVLIWGMQNGEIPLWRAVSIPFQENQLAGDFALSIDPFLFPNYRWLLFEGRANSASGCTEVQSRCDFLHLHWQP